MFLVPLLEMNQRFVFPKQTIELAIVRMMDYTIWLQQMLQEESILFFVTLFLIFKTNQRTRTSRTAQYTANTITYRRVLFIFFYAVKCTR